MFPTYSKFLVIDDFATMRKIIKKVLTELGYTNVEEAHDGKTGLVTLQRASEEGTPFDVVFSGWNMPQMSGIELLRACRASAQLKSTPFILITAESDQNHIIEAAKAGVSEYVVKPFNAITLKEKLERAWVKHQGKTAA